MKHSSNDRTPFWRNPRLRYGSLSTLLLAAALAALLLLNVLVTTLETDRSWRMDCSFNALTTHSEVTTALLAQLPYPVHLYALFPRGQEDLPLMELLNRYAAASDLVTWEQTDVSLNPGLLTRFRDESSEADVTTDSLIVSCEATGRWRVLTPSDYVTWSFNPTTGLYESAGWSYERAISSAIAYVTQDEIPRVLIVQGHGELDETAAAAFASLLTRNNYEVVFGRLAELDPAPGDLLALLSPVRDLSDSELATVTSFASQGGSLLFTCDYSDPIDRMPNVASLLRAYGFLPKDGIVIASPDEPGTYYDNTRINLIPTMLMGDTTADLAANGYTTLLLTSCRAFETPGDSDTGLIVTPVLSSGERAYLHDPSSASLSLDQQEGDETGPFALALEATRFSAEGNVSRAFVLGSSVLMTTEEIYAMTDAEAFLLRVAEYLLGRPSSDLDIMARQATRPALSARSYGPGSLLLVGLPLAVIGAALIILYPRRHR